MTLLSERLRQSAEPLIVHHPVRWLALCAICSPYLIGSAMKFMDYSAAVKEMESYGLLPAAPFAAAVIFMGVALSLMVITGFLRWIGALALATFNIVATLAALPFWQMTPGPDRLMALRVFVEHIALSGALVLVAWEDVKEARDGHG